MTVFELLGSEVSDAKRALQKSGGDFDELAFAIAKKNRADRTVARRSRSTKLPS
jgi:hypothetical protein